MPTSPSLSFNLTGISDYSTASPFIDLAKSMREFFVHQPNQWAGYSHETLQQLGLVDSNGYVTSLPADGTMAGTIWAWDSNDGNADFRKGVYVFTYEGDADFVVSGANVLYQEDGKIVLENVSGGAMSILWNNFDSQNYPKDFHLMKEENLGLFNAGAVFDPAWLDIVKDSRDFRFMDWMATNNSQVVNWADRPTLDNATWSGDNGVPVEVMVELCNLTGVNPWFTFPPRASAEYVQNLATYVRDNLDPNLEARFEYGNEMWNFAFQHVQEMNAQASASWGPNTWFEYHSMLATKAAAIVKDVFSQAQGDAPTAVNVLGTLPDNAWITERLLEGAVWQQHDPSGWIDPKTVFDEIATTTYFGAGVVTDSVVLGQLQAQIASNPETAKDWLAALLMDPAFNSSIPNIANALASQSAVASANGMRLVAYEGGQHVHHSFASGLTDQQADALAGWMADFVRSPQMAALYVHLADVWEQHGDGAFMQFGEISAPSRYGSWGIYSNMLDDNPRAQALFGEIAEREPWWVQGQNSGQYANGVVFVGGAGTDSIVGSDKSDNIAGMSGDDVILTGYGNDKVSGGAGTDTIVIAGASTEHVITQTDNGKYVITGTTGVKVISGVERVLFSDGVQVSVDGTSDQSGASVIPAIDTGIITGYQGLLINANNKAMSARDHDRGVIINGLNEWGAVAQQVNTDITKPVYAISPERHHVLVGGVPVHPDYFSLNDGRAGPGGVLIGDTALAGALRLADIVVRSNGVKGTSHNDTFYGRQFADKFYGEGGNDTLNGGGGRDVLYGGSGNDLLNGGDDNDQFYDEAGNDTIDGGNGDDLIYLGEGNNVVWGGAGNDRVVITGNAAATVDLSQNKVNNSSVYDVEKFDGAAGNDTMRGAAANDTFNGKGGHDALYGYQGNDNLTGEAGNDSLYGGDGNDMLTGGAGHDLLDGGAGKDFASWLAETSAILIDMQTGNHSGAAFGDVLVGIEGVIATKYDDVLIGDANANELRGGEGNDSLSGGSGNDVLKGETGNDTLVGGAGNDVMIGGAGSDVFIFATGAGNDKIQDFELGLDQISLVNQQSASFAMHSSGTGVLLTHSGGTVHLQNLNNADLQQILSDPDLIF